MKTCLFTSRQKRGRMRKGIILLFACLCLMTLDVWLLGKLHFCHLDLTRNHKQEERQQIEITYRRLVWSFAALNISVATGLIIAAIKLRSRPE